MQDADMAQKVHDIMDRFDRDVAELLRVHHDEIRAIMKEVEEERLRKVKQEIVAA